LLLTARIQQAGQLNKITVLLADDHPGFPHLVEGVLEPVFEIVGIVSNGRLLVDMALKLAPDIVVTDISMPILNGIDAVHQLKNSGCESKVVFLSIHSDPDFVQACLSVGALGYILKSRMAAELKHAIQEALAGRIFVTPGLWRRI
jgi:DNA-binding NarL/FixJ family response regulator